MYKTIFFVRLKHFKHLVIIQTSDFQTGKSLFSLLIIQQVFFYFLELFLNQNLSESLLIVLTIELYNFVYPG